MSPVVGRVRGYAQREESLKRKARTGMTVPQLTESQRADALQKAAARRKERSSLLARLKDGSLTLKEVIEREDPVVVRTPVRSLLQALPGIGRVRAGKLLTDLGIPERRRIGGLGSRQKARLLEISHA
ncbi:integration host factor, actinobacterial type [Streptomyces sp. NPDC059828]|uniref:integration host factor, actinobacterial type n=1 Tax=Streptomyces sp. NPDC059828 TaxID=3346965 RepID=UPI0036666B3B